MKNPFMQLAIEEALKAGQEEEIPVGAVIVCNNKVIAVAHNMREQLKDPTAHAEILAIRKAAKKMNNWRLTDCNIYVTLEPCPMCAAAIVLSRIKKITFGVYDPENGACGSIINIPIVYKVFGYNAEVEGGIMKDRCKIILQEFFRKRRNKYNNEGRDG